ncbi:hypothetical protein [Flavobacterium gilvum]|nr:hypothetical protein [Flavobacterium gilvum]
MIKFKTLLLQLFLGCSFLVFSKSQTNGNANVGENQAESGVFYQKNDNSKGYPVDPFDDTLFLVYNRIGVFSAESRAQAITKRIEMLSKDPLFRKDSLRICKSDFGLEIVYNTDFVVMSVTDSDGKKMGNTNFELAQKNLAIIQKAVLFHKENNLVTNWIKSLGILFLVLMGVFVIVFSFQKRFKKL